VKGLASRRTKKVFTKGGRKANGRGTEKKAKGDIDINESKKGYATSEGAAFVDKGNRSVQGAQL